MDCRQREKVIADLVAEEHLHVVLIGGVELALVTYVDVGFADRLAAAPVLHVAGYSPAPRQRHDH